MKTPMVLLVSAVVLLVGPAVANVIHQPKVDSLKSIIDHIKKVNTSLSKDLFVEEVGGCETKFYFCKVHDVLEKHDNFTRLGLEENGIVRNLAQLNRHEKCNKLKGVNLAGIEIQMPEFLKGLAACCRKMITNMGKSNA